MAARCWAHPHSRVYATHAPQFLVFGFFVCMDGFLHNLTYLPMRFAMAVVLMVAQPFVRM